MADRKPKCITGTPCGEACIAKGKKCLDTLDKSSQRFAQSVIDNLAKTASNTKLSSLEVDAIVANADFLSKATPAEIISRAFAVGKSELGRDYSDDPAIVDAVWEHLDGPTRDKLKTKGKVSKEDYWNPDSPTGNGGRSEARGKYMLEMYIKQNGKDAYTGLPIDLLASDLEHIIPYSEGGRQSENPNNFVLISRAVNQNRSNTPLGQWVDSIVSRADKLKAKSTKPASVDKNALQDALSNTPVDSWTDEDIDKFGKKFYYVSKHLGLRNTYAYETPFGRKASDRPPASWGVPIVKYMAEALRDKDLARAEQVVSANNDLLQLMSDKKQGKLSAEEANRKIASVMAGLQQRKPKCVGGTACGDSCISSSETCSDRLAGQSSIVNKLVMPYSAQLLAEDLRSTVQPVKPLYYDEGVQAKSDRIRQELDGAGLSESAAEGAANGLAAWLSLDYMSMSPLTYLPGVNPQLRRAPGSQADRETTDKYLSEAEVKQAKQLLAGAILAIQSLPEVTVQSLRTAYDDKVAARADGKPLTKPAPEADALQKLSRWITVADPEQFASKYLEGQVVTELGLFGTSHLPAGAMKAYSNRANISYQVKAKAAGTAGRGMDFAKTSAYEGEVLFPPGTKFRVEKVEAVDGKDNVAEIASGKGLYVMSGAMTKTNSGLLDKDTVVAETTAINKAFRGKYDNQAEADAKLAELNTNGYDLVAIPDTKAKTPGRYALGQPRSGYRIILEEVD